MLIAAVAHSYIPQYNSSLKYLGAFAKMETLIRWHRSLPFKPMILYDIFIIVDN